MDTFIASMFNSMPATLTQQASSSPLEPSNTNTSSTVSTREQAQLSALDAPPLDVGAKEAQSEAGLSGPGDGLEGVVGENGEKLQRSVCAEVALVGENEEREINKSRE